MKEHNSIAMMAFTVHHRSSDPADASISDIRAALMRRIADIDEHDEWDQAVSFSDTVVSPDVDVSPRIESDLQVVSESDIWTNAYSSQALSEGWDIFETGDGLAIQRDDEASVFADDLEAVTHVAKIAFNGSEIHRTAIRLHFEKD